MSSKPLSADLNQFAGSVPGERQRVTAPIPRLNGRHRVTSSRSVATESDRSREELIVLHADLVQRIARHLATRLPSTVDIDDLVQSGMVGLLEAAANFDPSRGACFATYAGIRIRGSMLDDLRKHDWTPRSVHHKYREVTAAICAIEGETGRPAQSREIAERLGISLDEYHRILADSARCRLFNLDETTEEQSRYRHPAVSNTSTPDQEAYRSQFREQLAAAIDRLPEREKLVLALYYEREMNLKEIGEILDVSESRVCQIHGQATLRLRAFLDNR